MNQRIRGNPSLTIETIEWNAMEIAPLPHDEAARLEALRRYAILDSLPEQQYEDLTLLAAQICDAPISLISLVEDERQWFKARVGLEASETPRSLSFCAHAILGEEVFEVPDATRDERFHDNALVTGAPDIRFYAGAPLVTPDHYRLGTLCVIDRKPRHLTDAQSRALAALARQAMSLLELRRALSQSQEAQQERELALRSLETNATLLRQFVEHAPAAIAMLDRNWKYVAVSRRFLNFNQLDGASVDGRCHFEACPHLPVRWRSVFEQALSGRSATCECDELRQVDGSHHFVQWEVLPWYLASGEVGGVIVFIEDISERVRNERLKSEFVSVVSHELRTPLTSIRGALGLLAGGVAGPLPERASQMIEIAHKNAGRLVLLINDILDIEKIESGAMRFEMGAVDVQSLLEGALEANRAYGSALGVSMGLESWPEELAGARVEGDEARLVQVLANLLSNAAKFTPSGGHVSLRAKPIEPPVEHNEEENSTSGGGEVTSAGKSWIRIEVSDEGEGVPPEFESRLFERFAQADSSATRQQGGTGLGLAIARAIVEKQGGRIGYLPPQPGHTNQGATFFFDLPLLETVKVLELQ